jgi:hypothetical protein
MKSCSPSNSARQDFLHSNLPQVRVWSSAARTWPGGAERAFSPDGVGSTPTRSTARRPRRERSQSRFFDCVIAMPTIR